MSGKRVSVRELALEGNLELDEALITLWDAGFDEISGPADKLARGEANRARRALGLATRRELSSVEYWSKVLSEPDLGVFLASLGVPRPFEGGRLTKRAIHRLRAESRRRGAIAPEPGNVEVMLEPQSAYDPLIWRTIGHAREIRQLTEAEVTAIHNALVADCQDHHDPISPPGIKSQALLQSAIGRPLTAIGQTAKYPTVEMAAAALFHALVHNHAFHNGNKRTALVVLLVFLDENGFAMTCDEDALFKLVLQLAQHALSQGPRNELTDRETLYVAQWIKDHSRWLEKGDRPLSWRRLRRILSAYGCTFETPIAGGNRINILRTVQIPKSFFHRKARDQVLHTQCSYGDEGREADSGTVKKIRHDLQLDDDHGYDSRAFYDNDQMSPGDFIIRYRKTLKRLARL